MTDKEFRRLSRAELIDIIFALQKQQEALQTENARLQHELDEKKLKISNAGSLADAVIAINGVLEAAQAAADQYIISVKANSEQNIQEAQSVSTEEDG